MISDYIGSLLLHKQTRGYIDSCYLKNKMSTALGIQRGNTDSSAVETWSRMEKNAFPGVETLMRNSPSHPQPEFLSLEPSSSSGQSSAQSSSQTKRHITGENTETCTPWVRQEYSNDMIGFHEEIMHFYSYMSPKRSERCMRLHVFEKVKSIILKLWPRAQVYPFGSFCTNLYLPTSDIDIVVLGEWVALPLFSLEEAFLKAQIAIEDSIMVLDKTTVPIIKFTDRETEVKVDISFNQETGLYSANLICQYVHQFPYLPYLAMIVKQFLVQRQLNEVYYGGINSYSLILMLVSFFQMHARSEAADLSSNLGVLLMEFFELYGRTFNYTKVAISIIDGGCYFPKEALDGVEDSLLYIQDPLEQRENACRGCYGIMQVKAAFEHAYNLLHTILMAREDGTTTRGTSLLSRIIQISKEVESYRNWTESTWGSATISSPPPFSLTTPIYSPLGVQGAMMHPPPHYVFSSPLAPIPPHHSSYSHQQPDTEATKN